MRCCNHFRAAGFNSRGAGARLKAEREAGKTGAFTRPDRDGVHHREVRQSPSAVSVVPHSTTAPGRWCIAARRAATGPLRPSRFESLPARCWSVAVHGAGGVRACRRLAWWVKGNMTDTSHFLQQAVRRRRGDRGRCPAPLQSFRLLLQHGRSGRLTGGGFGWHTGKTKSIP